MKKIYGVLIAVCCLAMAMPAEAQLKWGVKGGVNLSKLDWDGGVKGNKDNSTGFFIGPMAEVTIPIIGLGIDAALMYSQRGENGTYEVESETYEVKRQQGLEIPVNLKYTFGLGSMLGIYVAAGPDFFFNFKDIDIAGVEAKKTQVGLNLGAGVKLVKHLQIGVNYQIPMGDSFSWDNAGSTIRHWKSKTKTWQVSAAYIF